MAHETLVYRGRHTIINDTDLWALRHFLLTEAEATGRAEIASFVRSWQWAGNGVYIGTDFDAFLDGDRAREREFMELMATTIARIERFGPSVSLDYLTTHINSDPACFTTPQPTAHWAKQLAKLTSLISPPGGPERSPEPRG